MDSNGYYLLRDFFQCAVFVNYEKKVSEKNEKKKKKRGFVFIFGIDIMVQTLNKCFFFLFVYKI